MPSSTSSTDSSKLSDNEDESNNSSSNNNVIVIEKNLLNEEEIIKNNSNGIKSLSSSMNEEDEEFEEDEEDSEIKKKKNNSTTITTTTSTTTTLTDNSNINNNNNSNNIHRDANLEIFIGGIPKNIKEEELKELFLDKVGGNIHEVRLMKDKGGESKGFGFIMFQERSQRQLAIEKMNGHFIGSKAIEVKASENKRKIFIGNLPKDLSKGLFLSIINEKTEGISNVDFLTDPDQPKRNRGFAFIEYQDHYFADSARKVFSQPNFKFGDAITTLTVNWSDPEVEQNEDKMKDVKSLYIRNLPEDRNSDSLTQLFNDIYIKNGLSLVFDNNSNNSNSNSSNSSNSSNNSNNSNNSINNSKSSSVNSSPNLTSSTSTSKSGSPNEQKPDNDNKGNNDNSNNKQSVDIIEKVVIPQDIPGSNQRRDFAFIHFKSRDIADEIMNIHQDNPIEYKGRILSINFAKPVDKKVRTDKLQRKIQRKIFNTTNSLVNGKNSQLHHPHHHNSNNSFLKNQSNGLNNLILMNQLQHQQHHQQIQLQQQIQQHQSLYNNNIYQHQQQQQQQQYLATTQPYLYSQFNQQPITTTTTTTAVVPPNPTAQPLLSNVHYSQAAFLNPQTSYYTNNTISLDPYNIPQNQIPSPTSYLYHNPSPPSIHYNTTHNNNNINNNNKFRYTPY